MGFGNNLKKIRLDNNYTQEELAKRIDTSRSNIANYENDKNMPSIEMLDKLSSVLNVSIDTLLGKVNKTNDNKENIFNIKIPLLGTVKAGYDYLAEENIIDYVSVTDSSLNNTDFFALRVKGDSMVPEIYENDIAIVRKQYDFENGDYVVALINGDEATIKKAVKTEDGIELIAVNQYYPKRFFDKKEIKEMPVKIIGVVYNISRSFK